MSGRRDCEEELDTDLGDVEIGFKNDYVGQGDAELLLDPALVLGYRPAQQVWPDGKLINNAERSSSDLYQRLPATSIERITSRYRSSPSDWAYGNRRDQHHY